MDTMYEVNGFIFESEELANKARKEADGIKYIKSQTRMDNPDVVYDLYNKILQKKMFDTPVGIAFLVELQEYLKAVPYISNEDIRPIPVRNSVVIKTERAKEEKPKAEKSKTVVKVKHSKFFMFTTFVLVFAVIGMFAITYFSGNNTNIINYENEIINKYEIWEKQLDEKEAQLKAREQAIEDREAMLGEIVENGEN